MDRRSFLAGSAVGLTGGVVLGQISLSKIAVKEKELKASLNIPSLDSYPVVHYNSLFIIFTHIGQSIAPTLRSIEEYRKIENEVFRAVMGVGFFQLANDFIIRTRERLNDNEIQIPQNREITAAIMRDCVNAFPRGWASVVSKMLTFSSDVFLDFARQAQR